MGIAGDDAVSVVDDTSGRVDCAADVVPALTRALVDDGVAVYEIRPSERSLEDVFFELTSAPGSGAPTTSMEGISR
jgi:ABC-2 type transport system ATP-binding protein